MIEPTEIPDDEIILRRIPPGCAKRSEDGGRRPESDRLLPRGDEQGVSCNRLRLVSPQDLLNDLERQDMDPAGWMVAAISVGDVRDLGLEVVATPGPVDGHCEIRPAEGQKFKQKPFRRLAKRCRILTDNEVAVLNAGDQFK